MYRRRKALERNRLIGGQSHNSKYLTIGHRRGKAMGRLTQLGSELRFRVRRL